MNQYSTKQELAAAYALYNVSVLKVNTDIDSETEFAATKVVGKSKPDMFRKYGINSCAFVVEDFGFVLVPSQKIYRA